MNRMSDFEYQLGARFAAAKREAACTAMDLRDGYPYHLSRIEDQLLLGNDTMKAAFHQGSQSAPFPCRKLTGFAQ